MLPSPTDLDASDPLASFKNHFLIPDPSLIYLDGNSLGRLPLRSAERLRAVVEGEWGTRLIRGWGEGWGASWCMSMLSFGSNPVNQCGLRFAPREAPRKARIRRARYMACKEN